jgi:hypothetical protein
MDVEACHLIDVTSQIRGIGLASMAPLPSLGNRFRASIQLRQRFLCEGKNKWQS